MTRVIFASLAALALSTPALAQRAEQEQPNRFNSWDMNFNGGLEMDEFMGFAMTEYGYNSAQAQHFWASSDGNGDGIVTYEEWRGYMQWV